MTEQPARDVVMQSHMIQAVVPNEAYDPWDERIVLDLIGQGGSIMWAHDWRAYDRATFAVLNAWIEESDVRLTLAVIGTEDALNDLPSPLRLSPGFIRVTPDRRRVLAAAPLDPEDRLLPPPPRVWEANGFPVDTVAATVSTGDGLYRAIADHPAV